MEAEHQYLSFRLGEETFGLGVLAVREIIEYGGVTDVPMMPPCVRGVINLRGAVVPVLDLAARFGRAPGTIGRRSCIVIVESGTAPEQQVFGLLVDAVHAVLDIDAAQIEPPPGFGTGLRNDFITGIGKVNGKFVILVNPGPVLNVPEIAAMAGEMN
ncbi:purine-binding chemotaxis protein CheW [Duganella sp. CF458]|uniref:chemotaxis protein CheW n=1 Tax=Duganella sp. CF458 TaxID=1884368 RepID=UPI0008EE8DA3|nr:chemotaxis protein CheW [Duganella sp. CF458]SFH02833.1 purine-binding chemotaxis protein CheW [Duganella sp. CF458]